jgi:RNA polymerase sigma factor (sigma-70 family)
MRAQAPQNAAVGTGDAELVRRARGRDEAAVRSIMQSNNRRLYRIARGILRNESEAEDVVQETYVRAFTQLDDFRGDSSLAHLVCSTATGLLMPWIISSVMIEPSSMTKFEFDVARLEPARLRLAVRPTVKPRGERQAGSFEKMRMKSALRIDI